MLKDEIKNAITAKLPEAEVIVHNQNDDGQHFEAIVVSAQFEGLPLLRQHRLVMDALKEAFTTTVHALALKTLTPEQWNKDKSKYLV